MKFKVRETISLMPTTATFQTKHDNSITMCSSLSDPENILNVRRCLNYFTSNLVTCKATR